MIPGKRLGMALNPLHSGFIRAESPAFVSHNRVPVLPNPIALVHHPLPKGLMFRERFLIVSTGPSHLRLPV
jgi:hypothetical protein